MSTHIGFQKLNEKTEKRKKLIEESYFSQKMEIKDEGNNDKGLFNTHYSNPVYTCNYLIRIFPYSFSAIEFQGDGFDSPNRLFRSINKTLENTLSQKSDLREMIPEIYYFSDLYGNKNELEFGKFNDNEKVGNVLFNSKNESYLKYKYLAELRNYLETLLKLNTWIDLIFGVTQKIESKRKYFSYDMYVHVNPKKQKKFINNSLYMEKVEFGIQPLKIFEDKFPELVNKSIITKKLIKYNIENFEKEHIVINNNKDVCFKCFCFNNKNEDYIKIIPSYYNNDYLKKAFKNYLTSSHGDKSRNVYFHYIFIGDILGNITVFKEEFKGKYI